jgi:AcrR family transcriptional regulator
MGRPKGARSEGYESRRREILKRLTLRLSQHDAMHASYRDLAEAAEVSISTLQHYFGRRADIVIAVLIEAHSLGAPYLVHMSRPSGSFETSVRDALHYLRVGFERFGLDDLHALGFAEGLRNREIGPVFVDQVLEPSINAVTERLAEHQRRGEMLQDEDARMAALLLLSPMLVIFLHQKDLGGRNKYPADLDVMVELHVRAFVIAHQKNQITAKSERSTPKERSARCPPF